MTNLPEFEVKLDSTRYPVLIGHSAIDSLTELLSKHGTNKKVIIVHDTYFSDGPVRAAAQKLERAGYSVLLYEMHAGKVNKTIHEALKIFALLEENDVARDSVLVAVGGGVVGDLAGFIASTWLRGMKLVHIPTTLLAMVDSCIGGKTGVNFRTTINAIGSYYHPAFVLMDLDFVDSLSDRDYRSGLAEVIKCAVISDKKLFQYLESNRVQIQSRSEGHLIHCIKSAIRIKVDHVNGDLRESGKRLLLNYGHTLGHAIEMSTTIKGVEQLRHGEGVAIGMTAVAHLAQQYINTPETLYEAIASLLKSYGLPTTVSARALNLEYRKLFDQCVRTVVKDKKRINNGLRVILSEQLGSATVYENIPFDYIEDAFSHVLEE